MEKEIAVVSAFFNINRDNWEKFERSEDKYFEYFCGWAKLKNKVVVYVESERMRDKILAFRGSLGLEKNTVVIIVENYKGIAPDLYSSIDKATTNDTQKIYRLMKKNPEVWNTDYNYIMLLKMWCVQDAVARGIVDGMVAWVDFGYNHGGTAISSDSDFNFTWKYDFPEKINLFYVQEPDDRPIIDIVSLMDTYIMGTVIIGQDYLWKEFWELMKSNMMALNVCGMTDDDQNIILMCYREKPQLFCLFKSNWQCVMQQFGGKHLKLIDRTDHSHLIKRIGRWGKKWWMDYKYAYGIYKHARKCKPR